MVYEWMYMVIQDDVIHLGPPTQLQVSADG